MNSERRTLLENRTLYLAEEISAFNFHSKLKQFCLLLSRNFPDYLLAADSSADYNSIISFKQSYFIWKLLRNAGESRSANRAAFNRRE